MFLYINEEEEKVCRKKKGQSLVVLTKLGLLRCCKNAISEIFRYLKMNQVESLFNDVWIIMRNSLGRIECESWFSVILIEKEAVVKIEKVAQ